MKCIIFFFFFSKKILKFVFADSESVFLCAKNKGHGMGLKMKKKRETSEYCGRYVRCVF